MKLITYTICTILAGSVVNSQEMPDFPFTYTGHSKLFDRVEIFEDPTSLDSWYARAVITNVRGSYNAIEKDETSLGTVGIKYVTTVSAKLNDPDSADIACVVELPDNVIAIPECVSILEEDEETIYLYEYLGG